jgi:HSP20 family protein
MNNFCKN